MANEITFNASLTVAKGGVNEALSGSGAITMAGVNVTKTTQTIATTATQISFANLTGIPPALLIKNLDNTNFLQVDANNSFNGFPQKIRPGCVAILFPQTATIYAKADTAAVQIEYQACEP